MQTRLILEAAPRPKGSLIIAESWQDVQPILEHKKMLRSQPQKSDWGRHVATIPNVILMRWLDEEHACGRTAPALFGKQFDELVKRKLNDFD